MDNSQVPQKDLVDVIIIDTLSPEEGAMSQAVYSRNPKSILSQLLNVRKKGAQSFMSLYYSNYGHNSIGDCGSTTLYFENVSMLAAKAIQDWPLYNGQEASTRYLDFTGRIMIDPLATMPETNFLYIPKEKMNDSNLENIGNDFVSLLSEETGKIVGGSYIQKRWMAFYQKQMPIVRSYVANLNPKKENEDQVQYDKAVSARAFDIMRAFIPAGMTTLVSWHSNIRQLRDHLSIMKYHPSNEISRIAKTALTALKTTYPASFTQKEYPEAEEYRKQQANQTSYFYDSSLQRDFFVDDNNFNSKLLWRYSSLLKNRPKKTELPNCIGEAGTVKVWFKIDFGSFRDAQRHRKGVCKMPLLTTNLGFHPWYLENLPEETRGEAEKLISELTPLINRLPCDEVTRQYYIPMGFRVLADFTWTFDQCVYVAELRSSETVHPTFRTHAQALGKWIEGLSLPKTALYVDYSEDKWSYKRGSQDIIEKQ